MSRIDRVVDSLSRIESVSVDFDDYRHFDAWISNENVSLDDFLSNTSLFKSAYVTNSQKPAGNAIIPASDLSNPTSFLGGLGRELEDSLKVNTLDFGIDEHVDLLSSAIDVHVVAKHSTSRMEAEQSSGSDHNIALDNTDQLVAKINIYLHERVARSLRSKQISLEFLRKIIIDKIIIGSYIRQDLQYQKKVSNDVFELRVNEKIRVLYAKIEYCVLILYIIWDHKLSLPILKAQKEMSLMKNWMIHCGFDVNEPFVCVDNVSGRLRPLYKINLFNDHFSNSIDRGRISSESNPTSEIFSPSILDLVLSPQQLRAVESAIESTQLDKLIHKSNDSSSPTEILHFVVFQGSAGNGKTTCLLRTAMRRTINGDQVVVVAATRHLCETMKSELSRCASKGQLVPNLLMWPNVLDILKAQIIEQQKQQNIAVRFLDQADVAIWLKSNFNEILSRFDESEQASMLRLLMRGRCTADGDADFEHFFSLIRNAYSQWKTQESLYDDYDTYVAAKDLLVNNKYDLLSSLNVNNEVDTLVLDEAQLFQAATSFDLILSIFRPRKAIILGMDSKQALNFCGTSNRHSLYTAAVKAYMDKKIVHESRFFMSTNFRLPAKLISLSNSLVCILKDCFPKYFDEYMLDKGFEMRSDVFESINNDTELLGQMLHTGVDNFPANSCVTKSTETSRQRMITNYPIYFVSGGASKKLKTMIAEKLTSNNRAFLAVRFASMKLKDVKVATESDETFTEIINASFEKVQDLLQDLPTISFENCSGLEISLPVVVDNVVLKGVNSICSRKIFSQFQRKKVLNSRQETMMRTALCLLYTVLTRCRGPLIWLEDANDSFHLCLKWIKEKQQIQKDNIHQSSRTSENNNDNASPFMIEFINSEDDITDAFLEKIINSVSSDIDELQSAFEDSVKSVLRSLKVRYFEATRHFAALKRINRENCVQKFKDSAAFAAFSMTSNALCNLLRHSNHPQMIDFTRRLQGIEAMLEVLTSEFSSESFAKIAGCISDVDSIPTFARFCQNLSLTNLSDTKIERVIGAVKMRLIECVESHEGKVLHLSINPKFYAQGACIFLSIDSTMSSAFQNSFIVIPDCFYTDSSSSSIIFSVSRISKTSNAKLRLHFVESSLFIEEEATQPSGEVIITSALNTKCKLNHAEVDWESDDNLLEFSSRNAHGIVASKNISADFVNPFCDSCKIVHNGQVMRELSQWHSLCPSPSIMEGIYTSISFNYRHLDSKFDRAYIFFDSLCRNKLLFISVEHQYQLWMYLESWLRSSNMPYEESSQFIAKFRKGVEQEVLRSYRNNAR